MALLKYDADDLIASTRSRAKSPNAVSDGSADSDLLLLINETLQNKVFPVLLRAQQDFGVARERVALAASQTSYEISRRAAFGRMAEIFYIGSSGSRRQLKKTYRRLLSQFSTSGVSTPAAFILENFRIQLVPEINSSPEGSLEIHFYFRPSKLVAVVEVATIDQLVGGGVYHLTSTPTAFAANVGYDIHSPQSGANLRAWNITATAYNSGAGQITFAAADVDGSTFGRYAPQLGDYVCLAGECGIPFLPYEWHSILCQAAAVELMRAEGDFEAAKAGEDELRMLLMEASVAVADRVDDEPDIVFNEESFLSDSGPWPTGKQDQF